MNDCLSKTNLEQRESWKARGPNEARSLERLLLLLLYHLLNAFPHPPHCSDNVLRRNSAFATTWFVDARCLRQRVCGLFCAFESPGQDMFVGVWALSSVWLTRDKKKIIRQALQIVEPSENERNAGKCKVFVFSLTSTTWMLFYCTDCKAATPFLVLACRYNMEPLHNPVESYVEKPRGRASRFIKHKTSMVSWLPWNR